MTRIDINQERADMWRNWSNIYAEMAGNRANIARGLFKVGQLENANNSLHRASELSTIAHNMRVHADGIDSDKR